MTDEDWMSVPIEAETIRRVRRASEAFRAVARATHERGTEMDDVNENAARLDAIKDLRELVEGLDGNHTAADERAEVMKTEIWKTSREIEGLRGINTGRRAELKVLQKYARQAERIAKEARKMLEAQSVKE